MIVMVEIMEDELFKAKKKANARVVKAVEVFKTVVEKHTAVRCKLDDVTKEVKANTKAVSRLAKALKKQNQEMKYGIKKKKE